MENQDNVVKIAVHVNNKLVDFQASGKPNWAADCTVKRADRYASAWHQNQRILAHTENVLNKSRELQ